MKPEIKAAFKEAAQQYDARIAAQKKAEEQRNPDREEFEARWYSARQNIVVPALEQIRDELRRHGWIAEVWTSDAVDQHATLEIFKGSNMVAAGGRTKPRISFSILPHSQSVTIAAYSISQGGGSESKPLGEITGEFVQAKVLEFFERLTSGR